MESSESRSPLKGRPLRLPVQSVQDALVDLAFRRLLPSLWVAATLFLMAILEWSASVGHWRRMPWLYSGLAVLFGTVCAFEFRQSRQTVERYQLGRDGERLVGEYLERLRSDGGHVFHDIPANGFNLDHVLLTTRGFYVVETKTRTMPARGAARVRLTADSVIVGGFQPDRDSIAQVQSGARWLSQLLEESTGKRFAVRGVVVFPGWFVEPMPDAWKQAGMPWVLEPKALPAFIQNEPSQWVRSEVKLAAYHLSRYPDAGIATRRGRTAW